MSRRKRHDPGQVASVLNQQEAGLDASAFFGQYDISEQTFIRWKSEYGGIGVGDVRRLKALQQEN